MCPEGVRCQRNHCWHAHSQSELRVPTDADGHPLPAATAAGSAALPRASAGAAAGTSSETLRPQRSPTQHLQQSASATSLTSSSTSSANRGYNSGSAARLATSTAGIRPFSAQGGQVQVQQQQQNLYANRWQQQLQQGLFMVQQPHQGQAQLPGAQQQVVLHTQPMQQVAPGWYQPMAQQQQGRVGMGVVQGIGQIPETSLSLQPQLLQQGQQPYSQGMVQVLQVPQQLQLSTGPVVMQGPQALQVQQNSQWNPQLVQPQQQVVYIAQQPHMQQPSAGQTAVQGAQDAYEIATPQPQQIGTVAAQQLGPQQQQLLSAPGMALQQQQQMQWVQGIPAPQQQLQHSSYVVVPNSAPGLNQAGGGQQAMLGVSVPYHQPGAHGAGSVVGSSGSLQLVNMPGAGGLGSYGLAGTGAGALAVPPSSAAPAPVLVYDLSHLQAPGVGTSSSLLVDPARLMQTLQAAGAAILPSLTAAGAGSVVGAVGAAAVVPGGPGHVQLQHQDPQQQLILQQLMQQLGLGLQESQ